MDCYQQQQIPQMGGPGLTRYRSAPSSYFASILSSTPSAVGGDGGFGGDDFAELFNPRASSPETQRIFARFMNSTISIQGNSSPPRKKAATAEKPPLQQQRGDYSTEAMYQVHPPALESTYGKLSGPIKKEAGGGGGNYSLTRHSSSPAGLFDSITVETKAGQLGKDGGNDNDYIPEFPMSPWDESTILSDDFIKGLTDEDAETFVKLDVPDDQKSKLASRPPLPLSHHLSLPKSALEKLVPDSVPCKLRAKRGCATHPRSIAERVRRNKISERTRKLQEVVPNMDKQMNTATMLDLAVDYIKDLQKQVKVLSDNRARCTCSAK